MSSLLTASKEDLEQLYNDLDSLEGEIYIRDAVKELDRIRETFGVGVMQFGALKQAISDARIEIDRQKGEVLKHWHPMLSKDDRVWVIGLGTGYGSFKVYNVGLLDHPNKGESKYVFTFKVKGEFVNVNGNRVHPDAE